MSREVMYALAALLLVALAVVGLATREHMVTDTTTTSPTTGAVPGDFGQAVDIYKQNYIQYKTTGRVEYKTAYEAAESWIQQYLGSMESRVATGRTSITNFVEKNAGAGTELGQLGTKLKTIKREGPAAQDTYIALKRINEDVPEDNTDLYVKGGIAAAFVGVAVIMSAF